MDTSTVRGESMHHYIVQNSGKESIGGEFDDSFWNIIVFPFNTVTLLK